MILTCDLLIYQLIHGSIFAEFILSFKTWIAPHMLRFFTRNFPWFVFLVFFHSTAVLVCHRCDTGITPVAHQQDSSRLTPVWYRCDTGSTPVWLLQNLPMFHETWGDTGGTPVWHRYHTGGTLENPYFTKVHCQARMSQNLDFTSFQDDGQIPNCDLSFKIISDPCHG